MAGAAPSSQESRCKVRRCEHRVATEPRRHLCRRIPSRSTLSGCSGLAGWEGFVRCSHRCPTFEEKQCQDHQHNRTRNASNNTTNDLASRRGNRRTASWRWRSVSTGRCRTGAACLPRPSTTQPIYPSCGSRVNVCGGGACDRGCCRRERRRRRGNRRR